MFSGIGYQMCRTENVIYRDTWAPTGKEYIGKCQDAIKGRTSKHITDHKKFFDIQQAFKKLEITSTNPSTNPPKKRSTKKYSAKKTPKATLTQRDTNLPTTPTSQSPKQDGISHLITLINTKTRSSKNQISNDENEPSKDDIPQATPLIPESKFQKEFGKEMAAKERQEIEAQPNLQKTSKKATTKYHAQN